MKTMKILIMSAFIGTGITLASCGEDELIAPNDMTNITARKQTMDMDTLGGFGHQVTNGGVATGPTNGNGNGTNGNGNGNGGNGGFTGP